MSDGVLPLNPEKTASFHGGLSGLVLRRVVSHIEANLSQHISLEQLSAVAGLSRFHFARQFRVSTGHSPMGYVLRSRIKRARALLRDRETTTIARVAMSLGFADQSHFTRTFVRFCGVSPRYFADAAPDRESAEPSDLPETRHIRRAASAGRW